MNVIILAAGRGSRMQNSLIHKALLPYSGKAVLSHILDVFPNATFTIAVHHHQTQLRQFIQHTHGLEDISFVDVGSLDQHRAGPGKSLLKCLEHVKDSCFVVTSDSIVDLPKNADLSCNWIGVNSVSDVDRLSYCNVLVQNGIVQDVKDKGIAGHDYVSWSGMMHIKDWQQAIDNLTSALHGTGELQCSEAWKDLEFRAYEHFWLDTGTKERYDIAVQKTGFDYSKPDEITYVYPYQVVKFFADPERVKIRSDRQRNELNLITPAEFYKTENFVSYGYAPGETFYRRGTPELFRSFLNMMYETSWINYHSPDEERSKSISAFYKSKTNDRVKKFLASSTADYSKINGVSVSMSWPEIIAGLGDWVFRGAQLVNFHGDLQFDNIIVSDNNDFTLIDWRDSFDTPHKGDVYYELGKLLSGIHFDFDLVKKNLFDLRVNHGQAVISMPRRTLNDFYQLELQNFCKQNGYDWVKVKLISWMIIASMSGVHKEPFATCLYFYSLAGILSDKEVVSAFLM